MMAKEWEGPTFSSLIDFAAGRCELHWMQIATGVRWFAWFDVLARSSGSELLHLVQVGGLQAYLDFPTCPVTSIMCL